VNGGVGVPPMAGGLGAVGISGAVLERGVPTRHLITVTHFVGPDGKSLGIKLKECVVVSVDDEGAKAFGWQVGDTVEKVNETIIRSMDDLVVHVQDLKVNNHLPILFQISRPSWSTPQAANQGMLAARRLVSE